MDSLLQIIRDTRLETFKDSLTRDNADTSIENQFSEIQNQFPQYDTSFLWLLCYPYENAPASKKYIDRNYKKFSQYLDSGFPELLARKGQFNSRLWEMILCDILSSSGNLIPKSAYGADFLLEQTNKEVIQIEAVCPGEAIESSLQSVKPIFTKENPMFSIGGNIDDLEKPVLLRSLKAFDDKALMDGYSKDVPLVIAINSCNAVGLISDDTYILRRMLFGLGNYTITKKADGSHINGLQFRPSLNKPGKTEFPIARFLDSKYAHVSGVLYTSQNPLGLVPGGYGWHNSGITYAPNPNAKNKIEIEFPFFKTMICNEEKYEVLEASKNFESPRDF